MAHSSSLQKGQVPKSCDLCETDNKIDWKCVNCNLLMCSKCKEKVHSKFKSADKHKILDIKEVGQHSQEIDFSNINCEGHEGQICMMFCKKCDKLVCPQCIAKEHQGHRFVQISEVYQRKIDNVKKIQQRIKSLLKELTYTESKIEAKRKKECSKYTETRNLIEAQNAALKKEVDKNTEKLIKKLDQKWETLQNSFDEEENKVTTMKTIKEDHIKKIEDIINSNDADQVFKESKQMGKILKEDMEPVKLKFTTMPKFLPGEITEDNFGSLHHIPKVLALNQQFKTDFKSVDHLLSCPDNTLWISDDNVLQRVNPDGNNLKVVSRFNIKIYCMALTPSNDLLLKVKGSSRLKQISGSSGHVKDSVYSVDPLTPTAIHSTMDYKVMVGAEGDGRKVVIKINKEGKHEMTYEHDRNEEPIFTSVQHITTTTNGTIFVVDKEDDYEGRVVVLGQDGNIIKTYRGIRKVNNHDNPFYPVYVVTTPLDNIIVNDLKTDTLHILNSLGHIITYYNTNNIGIQYPYQLSFTSSGQLYIGGKTEDSTDNLFKVDISQI